MFQGDRPTRSSGVHEVKTAADVLKKFLPDRRREPFICKDNNKILEIDKDEKKKRYPTTPFKRLLQEKHGAASVKECGNDREVLAIRTHASSVSGRDRLLSAPSQLLVEDLQQAMVDMNMQVEKVYAYEIFVNMMKDQSSFSFKISDVPKRITAGMRAILVDWLVQVHEYLGLEEETLYLAIYLMNLYLKNSRIQIPKLQLLSATCLFLACKMEESAFPEPAVLCFMMEDTFDKKALLKMERKVLDGLQFRLQYTQPLHFLWLLTTTGKCSEETRYLAMYFMELTLMEADAVTFEPAQLAAAALCLAQKVLLETGKLSSDEIWDGAYKLYTYSDSELGHIQHLMAKVALRTVCSDTKATPLKYSRPQKLGVSTGPAVAGSQYLTRLLNRAPSA